jgi:hypothetical protein
LTPDVLDGILLKFARNLKPNSQIAKEANVKEGILLIDGTFHKIRGGCLPAIIALDRKSRLILHDDFVEENSENAINFIRRIRESGYKVKPYSIIDGSQALEKGTTTSYAEDIQQCIIHFQRNPLNERLPPDEECTDIQLVTKRLITNILYLNGHSTPRSCKAALKKADAYRKRLNELVGKADEKTRSVITSLNRDFNKLTTHLRHRLPYRDTNPIECAIRLSRKPVSKALKEYRDPEKVKAILKLANAKYQASVLGVQDWVRWSQINVRVPKQKRGQRKPRSETSP